MSWGPAVGPKTAFLLGSMSKSFTAVAVMQLVEAGKLDLDMPVRTYLPDFRVADEAASGQITLRHLLHHTSGIPSWAMAGDGADLKTHVAALADAPLDAAPGERHGHCCILPSTRPPPEGSGPECRPRRPAGAERRIRG